MVEGIAEVLAVLLRRFMARLLLECSGFLTVKLSSEILQKFKIHFTVKKSYFTSNLGQLSFL